MSTHSKYHDPAERHAARSRAAEFHTARSHLTETEIACYVDGSVDEADRTRIQLHVATCSDCARAVGDVVRLTRNVEEITEDHKAVLFRLEEESPDPETRARAESLVPDNRRRRFPDRLARRGRMYWASRVGIPIAVVALFWILRSAGSDPVSRFRSSGTPSSIHLTLPSDGSVLGTKDWRFELDAIEGALAYRFTISTLSGDLTYRSERSSPVVSVPDSIPRNPGRYAWTVDVVLASGRVLSSEMGTFVFNP